MKVWIQEWTESERGWGRRPDGFTAHRSKAHIDKFLAEMRAREALTYGEDVPDSYSYPEGQPFEVEINKKDLVNKKAFEQGSGCWMKHGWYPPKDVRNG